jgi:hypothetical protein
MLQIKVSELSKDLDIHQAAIALCDEAIVDLNKTVQHLQGRLAAVQQQALESDARAAEV